MFQFQNGAIKSSKKSDDRLPQQSFNSKMVRLKGVLHQATSLHLQCFNSKMVRLKGVETQKR